MTVSFLGDAIYRYAAGLLPFSMALAPAAMALTML
jgi:hypothetical protein